jgi:hypothetical protein
MRKQWKVSYKKLVLEYAEECGRDVKSYEEFGVSRSTFYQRIREPGASISNLDHPKSMARLNDRIGQTN